MATQVKRRRGTAAENAAFTGAVGELIVLTDTKRVAIHDGTQLGGYTVPNAKDVQDNAMKYGAVGGTANAITLTHVVPRTAHTAGAEVIFKPTANNSGAVTLAVDSIAGTKALEKMVNGTSTALSANDLRNGVVARAIYDGTRYQLQGTGGGSVVSVKTQVFTASGTYTPSTGMLYCEVKCTGAGGGGGGIINGTAPEAGGGGGAGGTAIKIFSAATIGASQSVTIGAGGGGGSTGGTNGSNGGNTTFGALLTGTGGLGGKGNNGGGSHGGAGSGATSGDINVTGGGGQAGIDSGGTSNGAGGVGGASYWGGGGFSSNTNTTGNNGVAYGSGASGGSGGTANAGGGTGAPGVVHITEYCSQ